EKGFLTSIYYSDDETDDETDDTCRKMLKKTKKNIEIEENNAFDLFLNGKNNAIHKDAINRIKILKLSDADDTIKKKYQDIIMKNREFEKYINTMDLFKNDQYNEDNFINSMQNDTFYNVKLTKTSKIMIIKKIENL